MERTPIIYGEANLYISYYENGDLRQKGPFWTISPDGVCPRKWYCYKVQTEQLRFERIIVPWYHTICGKKF